MVFHAGNGLTDMKFMMMDVQKDFLVIFRKYSLEYE
jgi:hypothetical protein